MEDPSKIGINLPPDTVESCYYPIVQVGDSARNKREKLHLER